MCTPTVQWSTVTSSQAEHLERDLVSAFTAEDLEHYHERSAIALSRTGRLLETHQSTEMNGIFHGSFESGVDSTESKEFENGHVGSPVAPQKEWSAATAALFKLDSAEDAHFD